ncbi:MAG: DUF378 domain-containing protein [Phycisphaerae bacterium]|nr:DUF378 domain-containing protein [Phycisphaerae bacterium]
MSRLSGFGWFCLILMMIGGINWGLIGFFNYNVVAALFGAGLERLIYVLVGLATLWIIGEAAYRSSERHGEMGRAHPV